MSTVWLDRSGNVVPGDSGQDALLEWMYGTGLGRCAVRLMIRPSISRAAGWLLDSRLSALAVNPLIRRKRINMGRYEQRKFRSFNDFFTRRIREGECPIDGAPEALIAPCDSKLSAYRITEDLRVTVKGTEYTVESLLRSPELSWRFREGWLLLFRLTVGDYHRYSFVDSGTRGETVHLPGVYHTVNPAAVSRYPVYRENTREYTLLETENFGTVLQMEVGAAMVGRIVNPPGPAAVRRGEEKGYFEFGGSTVIVLLEHGRCIPDADILRNTAADAETVVHLGERIGTRQ